MSAVDDVGNTIVLRFAGELDLANADDVRAQARAALDTPGVTTLIIDLSDVTFMDSTSIGAFIEIQQWVTGTDVDLRLRNLPARVRRVFRIAGLDPVFSLDDD